MKSGVYDISIEEYHTGQGFSRSQLINFNRSPLHFWYEAINNKKPQREAVPIIKTSNALEYGNALHSFVLEPETFTEKYYVVEKLNRATKEGKQRFQEAQKIALESNRLILCEEAWYSIVALRDGLAANHQASNLLSDAEIEKSIFWNDPDTGILCKVRPDVWHSNMIVDLKTTSDASERSFQRSVFQYGYHIQAGMIQEALKHGLGIEMNNFIFIAVEKEPPFASGIYFLNEQAVSQGVAEFRNIITGVKNCLDTGNWPSYPTATIDIPTWLTQ